MPLSICNKRSKPRVLKPDADAHRVVKEGLARSASREAHRLEKLLSPTNLSGYSLWAGFRVQEAVVLRLQAGTGVKDVKDVLREAEAILW